MNTKVNETLAFIPQEAAQAGKFSGSITATATGFALKLSPV